MQKETVELSFDFEKAGIKDIGDRATLDCYYHTLTEEIGRKKHRAMIICPGGGYDFQSLICQNPCITCFAVNMLINCCCGRAFWC